MAIFEIVLAASFIVTIGICIRDMNFAVRTSGRDRPHDSEAV
ncbi:hypothetical protein RA2_02047 [Roseovarius sp. A-2]|nr:hypothetical protein [Roseovarius sp. A-2]GAW34989.1 hypothetical protein RA2_02047 [Roseovarius sp. A-2]